MTRYRLPAALGGVEHDATADEPGYPLVGFDLADITSMLWLDRRDLTEVTPPGPPEPPVGSVWSFAGEALQRLDLGEEDNGPEWAGVGSIHRYTWARLWELERTAPSGHTPVRLVPDPTVGVELPWQLAVDGHVFAVGSRYPDRLARDGHVWVGVASLVRREFTADECGSMAGALLLAKSQLEADSIAEVSNG